MKRNKSLIITGNGADLYSKLETKYSDYINLNHDKIKESYNFFVQFKSIANQYKENHNIMFGPDTEGKIQNFPLFVISRNNSEINDFFADLKKELNNFPNNLQHPNEISDKLIRDLKSLIDDFFVSFKSFNLWECLTIVLDKTDGTWYDIERTINNFILSKCLFNKPDKSIFPYVDSLLNDIKNNTFILENSYYSTSSRYLRSIGWFNFIIFVLLFKHNDVINGNSCSYMLEELYEFENSFSSYIKKNISSHKEYNENICKLFHKIKGLSKNKNANLLTFNYTNPSLYGCHIKKTKNIHGNIFNKSKLNHSPIIIGIDSDIDPIYKENSSDYQNIFSFTKTKRILSMVDDYTNVLDSNIDEIIFFGHSLGEADYSYFQSIFDYYDIYNSNILIKFIFNPRHKSNDSEDTKLKKNILKLESQSVKVSNLINKYGETLDNINHGNNLLHKLLTQGRLEILNINDSTN